MNVGNTVAEIQQKYEREREKVEERKFKISATVLPKFLLPKFPASVSWARSVSAPKKKKKKN